MTDKRTTRAVLVKAREILSMPERWTRGTYARTADGSSTYYDDPEATCFCMMGSIYLACQRVGHDIGLGERVPGIDAMGYVAKAVGIRATYDVAGFNDRSSTTHVDVVRTFDDAIAQVDVDIMREAMPVRLPG